MSSLLLGLEIERDSPFLSPKDFGQLKFNNFKQKQDN